jgi:hypothetical protein
MLAPIGFGWLNFYSLQTSLVYLIDMMRFQKKNLNFTDTFAHWDQSSSHCFLLVLNFSSSVIRIRFRLWRLVHYLNIVVTFSDTISDCLGQPDEHLGLLNPTVPVKIYKLLNLKLR